MKFWISKSSEVSIREQIVTQIRLGVVSRDLMPGEKLPSIREMARRFGIHANTVSAAYRELAAEKLVELRKGSGVFVAGSNAEVRSNGIDTLFANFVAEAFSAGFSRPDIEPVVSHWLNGKKERKLLLVESDGGLRSIITEEISAHLGVSPEPLRREELADHSRDGTAIVVALFDERPKVEPLLSPTQKVVFIDANSVPHALLGNKRPDKDNLIAVVSCWSQFVALARVYLIAATIDSDALIIRCTDDDGWQSGLDAASIVICDLSTARYFGADPRLRVFRIITEASLDRLKHALL